SRPGRRPSSRGGCPTRGCRSPSSRPRGPSGSPRTPPQAFRPGSGRRSGRTCSAWQAPAELSGHNPPMTDDEELAVLRRGMDQLEGLVADVRPDALDAPTPCTDWTVRDLVDHVVAAPARFARMMREEPIDWSAPTPPAGD